jgi:hypothetical protein
MAPSERSSLLPRGGLGAQDDVSVLSFEAGGGGGASQHTAAGGGKPSGPGGTDILGRGGGGASADASGARRPGARLSTARFVTGALLACAALGTISVLAGSSSSASSLTGLRQNLGISDTPANTPAEQLDFGGGGVERGGAAVARGGDQGGDDARDAGRVAAAAAAEHLAADDTPRYTPVAPALAQAEQAPAAAVAPVSAAAPQQACEPVFNFRESKCAKVFLERTPMPTDDDNGVLLVGPRGRVVFLVFISSLSYWSGSPKNRPRGRRGVRARKSRLGNRPGYEPSEKPCLCTINTKK